jgi:hypothetical protein
VNDVGLEYWTTVAVDWFLRERQDDMGLEYWTWMRKNKAQEEKCENLWPRKRITRYINNENGILNYNQGISWKQKEGFLCNL